VLPATRHKYIKLVNIFAQDSYDVCDDVLGLSNSSACRCSLWQRQNGKAAAGLEM